MPRLYLDLETYNEQPISGGSYRYAETVEVTLFAYAIDDQPAKVWDRANKEPMPEDLKAAIKDPKTVFIAHNSMFDRVQLATLSPRFADPKNWEDTMVKAYLHGLPGKLEHLCDLFGLSKDKAKDKDGKRLVQMFCMPHDAWKIRRCTKETHPEDWERFVNYARLDVEAMRELDRLLPKRNTTQTEMSLWHLDQKINDRGFGVDTELVEAAIIAVDREQKELKKRTLELTEGELSSTTKRDAFLLQILKQYGIELDDARASTIEKLLDDESLPVGLKGLLETRLSATTSSTAKYKKFKQVVCKDGRVRGGLQFSGAARTRRFCIAEGSLILVKDQGNIIRQKPIQEVLLSDKVFDGDEWVHHEGVVYSGDKDVITHDNVVATTEHLVYLSDNVKVTLLEAKNAGKSLWGGNVEKAI